MDVNEISEQFFVKELKCSYLLRNKKSNKPQMVYCIFRMGGKQYKISTGAKVYPSSWRNGCPLPTDINDKHNVEVLLRKIREKNNAFVNMKAYLCNTNDVSDISSIVSKFFNYKEKKMAKKEKRVTISKLMADSIDLKRCGESSKKQYLTKVHTFIGWMGKEKDAIKEEIKTAKENDKERLQQKMDGYEDEISNINYSLLFNYEKYMLKKGKTEKYVASTLKTLLDIFKHASDKKLFGYVYDSVLNDIGTIDTKICDNVLKKTYFTLDENEINQLHNLNGLSDKEQLVRDLFLFECYTGQRIEDVKSLVFGRKKYEKYSTNGMRFIAYNNQKTKTECLVPIKKEAQQIMDRYSDYDIDFCQKNTKGINSILKKIAKKAGLNRAVKQRDKENTNTTTQVPMYQALHTHTGRHTFVTLAKKWGWSVDDIIKVTGHKDGEMVRKIYDNTPTQTIIDKLGSLYTKQEQQVTTPTTPTQTPTPTLTQGNDTVANYLVEKAKQAENQRDELQETIAINKEYNDLQDYFENDVEDVQDFCRDVAENNLIEWLNNHLITKEEYEQALDDPQMYEELNRRLS